METLLEKLNNMSVDFTMNDVQQAANNIACKLHTLLTLKNGALTEKETRVFKEIAEKIVTLAQK